jgi:hypothetical protein
MGTLSGFPSLWFSRSAELGRIAVAGAGQESKAPERIGRLTDVATPAVTIVTTLVSAVATL